MKFQRSYFDQGQGAAALRAEGVVVPRQCLKGRCNEGIDKRAKLKRKLLVATALSLGEKEIESLPGLDFALDNFEQLFKSLGKLSN